MLPNLRIVLYFDYLIIGSFKKVFMYHFAIDSIVVYRITIILNKLHKVINYKELRVVKSWLT